MGPSLLSHMYHVNHILRFHVSPHTDHVIVLSIHTASSAAAHHQPGHKLDIQEQMRLSSSLLPSAVPTGLLFKIPSGFSALQAGSRFDFDSGSKVLSPWCLVTTFGSIFFGWTCYCIKLCETPTIGSKLVQYWSIR